MIKKYTPKYFRITSPNTTTTIYAKVKKGKRGRALFLLYFFNIIPINPTKAAIIIDTQNINQNC